MFRLHVILTILLAVTLALSCSHTAPLTVPDITDPQSVPISTHTGSNTHLWGIWDVSIDPSTGEIDIVPLRGMSFTANITKFIDATPGLLGIGMNSVDSQPTYLDLDFDVSITHPFPGLTQYIGFDVLGVFLGDGDEIYPGPGGYAVAGAANQQLFNADGYTRWYNAPEFETAGDTMAIAGYYEGALAPAGYVPTAQLNPYKYFSDTLTAPEDPFHYLTIFYPDRGSFWPGSTNSRNYIVRFPKPGPTQFQYAVIGHWEPNAFAPDPPIDLGDFPWYANMDEAPVIDVNDYSDAFYEGPSLFGGHVILDLKIFDWSAELINPMMEEYEIFCYSPAWTGNGSIDMTPTATSPWWYQYTVDIPVDLLDSADPIEMWIEVSYPALDYTNPWAVPNDAVGPLCSFFKLEVPVSTTNPYSIEVALPNGGETLYIGEDYEILWTAPGLPGTVTIEYSKDDFGTDINIIATGEPNDNTYMWIGIPNDPTIHGKVRITSEDYPSVSDMSDSFFVIEEQLPFGWARTWGGSDQRCFGIAVDSDGNSYATGFYRSLAPADFDPGPGEDWHTSNSDDIFLTKFDDDGDFQWARTWGDSGTDEGHGVEVADGYVYVTGFFRNTADFDTGTGIDDHSASGSEDVFLSKFDTDGNFVWAETWGSAEVMTYSYYPFYGDCGEHVAVDGLGKVYVVGDQGTPFLRRFASDGTLEWDKYIGTTDTFDRCYGLAVTASGQVYMSGRFTGTVDLNPGIGVDNHTATGHADSFLIGLDASGAYGFGHHWGGTDKNTGYANPPYYADCSYSVGLDASDDVYVTGIFYGTTDFDPGAGTVQYTTVDSGGYGDGFVSKFTGAGTFEWVRVFQGEHFQEGFGVDGNANNDVYVTGRFYNTVDFDPLPGVQNHISAGDCDIFVSKYDSSGNWDWTRSFGAGSYDIGSGVDSNATGSVWMSGYYTGIIDFDPGPGTENHGLNGSPTNVILKLLGNGFWE